MSWPLPVDLVNETTGLMEGTANWANNVTHGTYWSLLLAVFCVVLGVSSVRFGFDRAIGFAGITGLLGAVILLTLGLMTWWIASIFIILGAVGMAYMILNKG